MKFHVAAHACNSSRVLREENAEFRTRQLDLTLPPPHTPKLRQMLSFPSSVAMLYSAVLLMFRDVRRGERSQEGVMFVRKQSEG